MTTQVQQRRVQRRSQDGTWKDVNFMALVKGDDFQMFEPDGTQVIGDDGRFVWLAISDAYGPNGIETIDVEEIPK